MQEGLRALYARYLEHCNRHDFEALDTFVAHDVRVNDEPQGFDAYIHGLRRVRAAFPDYRWELRHLLIDGCWLAAHFIDSGTHAGAFLGVEATGRVVATRGFAIYRIEDERIVEVSVKATTFHCSNSCVRAAPHDSPIAARTLAQGTAYVVRTRLTVVASSTGPPGRQLVQRDARTRWSTRAYVCCLPTPHRRCRRAERLGRATRGARPDRGRRPGK